mmetsp:Transcript_26707/g.53254  ORF Transcript_26707/g.53254 Transcript_26707/m.53254 type:complete len:114 (+) Transcript_26707:979-1320(+)
MDSAVVVSGAETTASTHGIAEAAAEAEEGSDPTRRRVTGGLDSCVAAVRAESVAAGSAAEVIGSEITRVDMAAAAKFRGIKAEARRIKTGEIIASRSLEHGAEESGREASAES